VHTRGILVTGPPGTGKSLISRRALQKAHEIAEPEWDVKPDRKLTYYNPAQKWFPAMLTNLCLIEDIDKTSFATNKTLPNTWKLLTD
jgi:Cdc6-like AAA superfamily ATPase